MHVAKGVFKSTTDTLLDIPGKTKDRLSTCKDLQKLGIRPQLHPQERPNGKCYLPLASFTLTLEEKRALYEGDYVPTQDVLPLSFFDMMEHYMIHIADQIFVLGPVHLHDMYPYEYYMNIMKGYVCNHAHPKGSMIEGYTTEEVL
jgi:hypothetical protein